jgi:hypothetical protein
MSEQGPRKRVPTSPSLQAGGQSTGIAWPNLFIVGAGRSGTTSLWSVLGSHPEICKSRLKEPHFFADWPLGKRVRRDVGEYLALFEEPDARYRVEASTTYLWQEASAQAIKTVSPDARIVISLRDPISRAYSAYLHHVRLAGEKRSFLEAITSELVGRRSRLDHIVWCVLQGRYPLHLERFLSVFGRDRVHVLFFEELVADPAPALLDLYRFLDLEPAILRLPHENRYRPARGGVGSLLLSRRGRKLARRVLPHRLRRAGEHVLAGPQPKPEMGEEARSILARIYEPERPALEALLRRPLPW